MRRASVLALLLVLPSAALWEPFVHAHLDKEHATSHHAGRVIHSHSPSHTSNGIHPSHVVTLVAGEEEEADKVTTFLARECCVLSPHAAIEPLVGMAAPSQPSVPVSASLSVRNHDPPPSRLYRPRAPPA